MELRMLINCVVYRAGKKLADLAIESISDYLQQPDCFVWVALRDATPAELEKMREEFSLHPLAIEDAHKGHQRPKIEEYGETLFAVLHTLEQVDGEISIGELDIFVGHNFILSVRNRSSQGLLGVRERCEREPALLSQGSGFVLYALMDAVVDRYFPIIDYIESELEAIEEKISSSPSRRAASADFSMAASGRPVRSVNSASGKPSFRRRAFIMNSPGRSARAMSWRVLMKSPRVRAFR
jgi:magnesium transporter